MNCKHCGRPLDEAQERGDYKSCPHCSQNSDEHIFYPKAKVWLDGAARHCKESHRNSKLVRRMSRQP